MAKVIQIVVDNEYDLVALDSDGVLWAKVGSPKGDGHWHEITGPPVWEDDDCDETCEWCGGEGPPRQSAEARHGSKTVAGTVKFSG